MANTGNDKQAGVRYQALKFAAGGKTNGAVSIPPNKQSRWSDKSGERGTEKPHVNKPALDDLQDVVDGARNSETVDVAVKGAGNDARVIPVHAAKRGGLKSSGENGNLTGEPGPKAGLIEADELMSEIAEGIGRREKNQAPNTVRMTRGKHDGYRTSMRVAGNIRLLDIESVHAGSQSICGRFESGVQPWKALRLPHVREINGKDVGMISKK